MDNRQIANEIVEQLFTNGFGNVAERLVMLSANGRNLGGWSQDAVRDQVLKVLEEQVR
jgi:hypothetical protein